MLTALLAAAAVMRLTANRVAAVIAAPLVIVTPWATHQHGLLLPEQLGAPLLLGAALLAARPATARWAGVLAAVAVFSKLPFALPAAAIILASPARGVALRWAAGTLAAQALAFTVLFGTEFWRQIVQAQFQAGHGLQTQVGPWAQATWNLLPLVPLAAVAIRLRRRAVEPALLRTLGAAAAGMLVTVVTIVKPGTGLNVLVPSEPLLVTLAVAGAVWAQGAELRRPAAVATAVLTLLLLAQSASLLIDPTNPRPFTRPGSATPGWRVLRTREEVDRLAEAAERCPPGSVYTGPPLVALLAHRRVPAGQPDVFIVSHAALHSRLFARLRSDGPRCP